jgi:hypothetical protein
MSLSNSSLYTRAGPDFNKEFKILQYNVDQSMREEKVPMTKWNNRVSRVEKLILDANADIV